jgi:hypothetical protein
MKKRKSPWIGVLWIIVWTAALAWFYYSEIFNTRELIGLTIVWATLVAVTVYYLAQHVRMDQLVKSRAAKAHRQTQPLNAPCPCGSGKKYKRCCRGIERAE